MNEDLERPMVRLQILSAGIAVGGLLLGAILVTIGVTKVGMWTLTFNVGLLLVLFGVAGVRVAFLAREIARAKNDDGPFPADAETSPTTA